MIAKVCACGATALPGASRCAACEAKRAKTPPMPERMRTALQPYRRSYHSAEYRANRALVRKAATACAVCGYPLGRDFEIHHIVPLRDGGTDDVGNLAAVHRHCHKGLTAGRRAQRRREKE